MEDSASAGCADVLRAVYSLRTAGLRICLMGRTWCGVVVVVVVVLKIAGIDMVMVLLNRSFSESCADILRAV